MHPRKINLIGARWLISMLIGQLEKFTGGSQKGISTRFFCLSSVNEPFIRVVYV